MTTRVTGTIVDGGLTLDERIDLPNNCRVSVTIEAVEKTERSTGWEGFEQLLRDRPIHSGGLRFTRDELHERG
jgi:hypothetical protein